MAQTSKIGAVSLGSSNQRRNKFDYTHTVTTTHGFTEVQPEFFRFMQTAGRMKLRTQTEVRVAPVNVPTFGIIDKRYWHYFFPLEELTTRASELYSTTMGSGGNLGQIFYTEKFPNMPVCCLSLLPFYGAHCTVWMCSNGWVGNKIAEYKLYTNNTTTLIPNKTPSAIISRLRALGYLVYDQNRVFDGYSGFSFNFDKVFGSDFVYPLNDGDKRINIPLNNGLEAHFLDSRVAGSSTTAYNYGGIDESPVYLGKDKADYVITKEIDVSDNQDGSDVVRVAFAFRFSDFGRRLRKIYKGLGWQIDITNHELTNLLPLFGYYATYWMLFKPELYVNFQSSCCKRLMEIYDSTAFTDYRWAFDKTPNLGPHFSDNSETIVQLSYLWDYFVKELADCFTTDSQDFFSAHTETTAVPTGAVNSGNATPLWQSGYQNRGFTSVGGFNGTGLAGGTVPDVDGSPATDPLTGFVSVDNHAFLGRIYSGQVDLEMLKRLYAVTNRQTILGQRVRELLANQGYGKWMEKNKPYFIGSSHVEIHINDVPSSADTYNKATDEGKNLGEWGANGSGFGASKTFKYETNTVGFWFTLSAVVPRSGFAQGIDPNLMVISKNTGYNQEYDGVGYEANRKYLMCGSLPWVDVTEHPNSPLTEVFGLAPNMSRFKMITNKMNGDVDLGSEQNRYRSYILDKLIDVNDHRVTTTLQNTGNVQTECTSAVCTLLFGADELPACGTPWRFTYRYPYLGHLERIFTQNSSNPIGYDEIFGFLNGVDFRSFYDFFHRSSDGFLSFSVFYFSTEEPKKQIADSYETKDDGNDGKTSVLIGKA